jgi:hypothetical protein
MLLVWMLVAAASAKATPLPATITENTTLTASGSPYTGSTTIEPGATLNVEPGVTFKISRMTVKGTLKAEGTAEKPIVFTGAKEAAAGEWCRIGFEPGSGASVIDHAEVKYAGGCGDGGVVINGSSPRIRNSTFEHDASFAIHATAGGSPEIANNRLANNGQSDIYYKAASTQKGEINIHGNEVEGGEAGIRVVITSTGEVFGKTLGANTITKTTGTAFLYEGTDIPGDITGNTLVANTQNLITIGGTVAHTETWNNGGTPIKVAESVTVASGATLTITKGVFMANPKTTVKGTLKVEGTAAEPVVFTGAKEEKPQEWCAITFEPGSGASVIDHAEVKYAGGCGTGGIAINGSSPTIKNSTLEHNASYGIKVSEGGSPEIANNRLANNPQSEIYYSAGGTKTGEVNIHGNEVEGGEAGIRVIITSTGEVFGKTLGANTITKTTGTAFAYEGTDIPGDITGNALVANTQNVITISGTVAHSEAWNDSGTPIKVASSITVASGAILTITKGVFLKSPKMTVNGTLQAEGTATEPVVFTGAKEETAGEWCRIIFEPGSGASVLDHAEVKYAGGCGDGGVVINGSSPTIRNSTFEHDASYAIHATAGGSPEIANNRLANNGQTNIYYKAASTQKGEVNIHGNEVEGGQSGIYVSITSTGGVFGKTLGGNTVRGTTGTAFLYMGPDIPGDISENNAENNAVDALQISGTVARSATWTLGGAPVRFTSSVVVAAGVTLTLQPGVYIQAPSMSVFGALRAEGSASRPVTLTGSGQEENGEWGGINLEAGSGSSLLNYTEVGFGGSTGPMLNVRGVSPTITNSTFRRSAGDAIRVQQSGQPIIEGNRFRDNHFGLRYEGEGKLHAPNNDWGCANGPKPTGCGDEVTSNVEWRPAAVLQELPRLCPGTTMLATSTTCLLQKYEPQLRYDSEENYYADSSAEITDNWGDEAALDGSTEAGRYSNALIDESEWPMIKPLAFSSPLAEEEKFPLTRSALGATYPNGQSADSGDWLAESEEYVRDAHRLEAAGYLNAAYAHAYTDANGKRWLEYWYWYYYNPKDFAGVGKHEGDWETVIVGLDPNSRPEEVIFSQHDGASNCYIGEVEQTEEGGPVVYVGLDSHAGYEKPGVFWATGEDDWADGAGPWAQPGLTVLDSSLPSWILWPGHWGATRPEGSLPGEATSPEGPYFHQAWGEPNVYAENAFECTKTAEEEGREPLQLKAVAGTSSLASIRGVSVVGRRPQVSYKVPKATGHGFWPRLRISVNELGDGGIPPVSKMISNVKTQGRVTVPIELKAGHAAEVLGSIVYKNGRRVHLAHRIVRVR